MTTTPANFSDDLLNKGVQKNKGKSESGVSGAVQADSAVAFPQLAKSVGDVGDSGHMLDLVLSQALGTAKDANPTDFSSTKLSKVVQNSEIGSLHLNICRFEKKSNQFDLPNKVGLKDCLIIIRICCVFLLTIFHALNFELDLDRGHF